MEISRYVMLIKSSFRPHRISYKLNISVSYADCFWQEMLVFHGKAQAAIQALKERASTMIRAEEHPQ
jgi:hypothetical protein